MITITSKQYNKIIRNADTKLFDELGYDDILWIDMMLPTIKEQKAVENFMEISLQTKQQVEEIESTSKYRERERHHLQLQLLRPHGRVVSGRAGVVHHFERGACWSRCATPNSDFRETEKRLQMNYRSYSTGYHLFISRFWRCASTSMPTSWS